MEQFENCSLIENFYTRNTSNTSELQELEVTMRHLCRAFGIIKIFFQYFVLLLHEGGGQPPNQSIPPPVNPLLSSILVLSWTHR